VLAGRLALVVGAGAFADSLVANSDFEVVLVDRRDRPGGHWLDALEPSHTRS
jgi:hypothetical protein